MQARQRYAPEAAALYLLVARLPLPRMEWKMIADRLSSRLLRLRKQLGLSYFVTLRVGRRGITWVSFRSRYEDFDVEDGQEALPALRKLNRHGRGTGGRPNYIG